MRLFNLRNFELIIYFGVEGMVAKLNMFLYNNKPFYNKTRKILISENEQQNKKRDRKKVNLLNMASIFFFNYCITMPLK